jgi:hypothetical protein
MFSPCNTQNVALSRRSFSPAVKQLKTLEISPIIPLKKGELENGESPSSMFLHRPKKNM